VIERPASVVKELVENALDAGAGRITVEIQAGGRSLVAWPTTVRHEPRRRPALPGAARDEQDSRAEDLAAIATMGFRGEALPSIASVSRFTLTTRERGTDSPEGTQIIISGGKILEVKAAGTAPHTLEVRQLFFNLPARRKFLRTEETESAHIQHYLTLAALAFPEVRLQLRQGRPPGLAAAGRQIRRRCRRPPRRPARTPPRPVRTELKLLPVDFTGEYLEPIQPDEAGAGF